MDAVVTTVPHYLVGECIYDLEHGAHALRRTVSRTTRAVIPSAMRFVFVVATTTTVFTAPSSSISR